MNTTTTTTTTHTQHHNHNESNLQKLQSLQAAFAQQLEDTLLVCRVSAAPRTGEGEGSSATAAVTTNLFLPNQKERVKKVEERLFQAVDDLLLPTGAVAAAAAAAVGKDNSEEKKDATATAPQQRTTDGMLTASELAALLRSLQDLQTRQLERLQQVLSWNENQQEDQQQQNNNMSTVTRTACISNAGAVPTIVTSSSDGGRGGGGGILVTTAVAAVSVTPTTFAPTTTSSSSNSSTTMLLERELKMAAQQTNTNNNNEEEEEPSLLVSESLLVSSPTMKNTNTTPIDLIEIHDAEEEYHDAAAADQEVVLGDEQDDDGDDDDDDDAPAAEQDGILGDEQDADEVEALHVVVKSDCITKTPQHDHDDDDDADDESEYYYATTVLRQQREEEDDDDEEVFHDSNEDYSSVASVERQEEEVVVERQDEEEVVVAAAAASLRDNNDDNSEYQWAQQDDGDDSYDDSALYCATIIADRQGQPPPEPMMLTSSRRRPWQDRPGVSHIDFNDNNLNDSQVSLSPFSIATNITMDSSMISNNLNDDETLATQAALLDPVPEHDSGNEEEEEPPAEDDDGDGDAGSVQSDETPFLERYRLVTDDSSCGFAVVPNLRGRSSRKKEKKKIKQSTATPATTTTSSTTTTTTTNAATSFCFPAHAAAAAFSPPQHNAASGGGGDGGSSNSRKLSEKAILRNTPIKTPARPSSLSLRKKLSVRTSTTPPIIDENAPLNNYNNIIHTDQVQPSSPLDDPNIRETFSSHHHRDVATARMNDAERDDSSFDNDTDANKERASPPPQRQYHSLPPSLLYASARLEMANHRRKNFDYGDDDNDNDFGQLIFPEKRSSFPIPQITNAEYQDAPRIVRMQISHEEVERAIDAINKGIRLDKTRQNDNSNNTTALILLGEHEVQRMMLPIFQSGVGFEEDNGGRNHNKSKAVLLGLCHWRRLVVRRHSFSLSPTMRAAGQQQQPKTTKLYEVQ